MDNKSHQSTRKLIKWGSSNTLIISLPRRWIKDNNLSADQIVKIQTNQDGTLTIIPQELTISEELETIIRIKDPDDLENIRLRILTKYLDGWDIIKIESTSDFSSGIKPHIEEIINPLLGLEIFGISGKTILLKNVMAIESSNVFNLIKMISNSTIELGEMVTRHLEDAVPANQDLGQMEWENIRKYHYRITREQRRALLHPASLAKMELTLQDVMDITYYVNNIFKIADAIRSISDIIKKQTIPTDDFGVTKFFKSIMGFIRDSVDSFLSKETRKSVDVIKKIKNERPHKREIENKVDAATGKNCEISLICFQVLLDLSEKIMDYCDNVCLAALRRAI